MKKIALLLAALGLIASFAVGAAYFLCGQSKDGKYCSLKWPHPGQKHIFNRTKK